MRTTNLAVLVATVAVALGAGAPANAKDPPGVNPTHYQCYLAKPAKPFQKGVVLTDQFGKSKVMVLNAVYLCAPVDKDGEGLKDKDTHLVCYQDKGVKAPKKKVMVINQFGEQVLTVNDATWLCVPLLKKVL